MGRQDALMIVISIIVLALCMMRQPTSVTCAKGFFVDGVRPTGDTRCVADDYTDRSYQIRLYCTGGTIPIVGDDGRTVGCQMRH